MKDKSVLRLVLVSLLCSLLFLSACVLFMGCGDKNETKQTTAVEEKPKPQPKEEPVVTPQQEEPVVPPAPAEPPATVGEKNALNKAKDYLAVMAFSYTGLIEQLEYDGFSHEEAVYGADRCGANWNEQAAKKAQSYLDVMSFSRSGLIEQLKYDGFTQEQAEYGVQAVGY